MALRGMDMSVHFGMDLKVMNAWTRAFKVNPSMDMAWGNGTHGRTFWTMIRSETPVQRPEFIVFISVRHRTERFTLKPHQPFRTH